MANRKIIDDLDKNSLANIIVNHGENLNVVSQRVDFLEKLIGNETSFAETFCEASVNTKKIDETVLNILINILRSNNQPVSDSLVTLLKSNDELKDFVSALVEDLDRSHLKRLRNKIGYGMWSLLLVGLGAVGDRILRSFY